MRIVILAGLLIAFGTQAAGAADYPYGYRAPEPPPPVYSQRGAPPDDDDDDDDDRPVLRETERPRHYHRHERYDRDDGDCWIRRTPYGPERVCR